MIDQIVVVDAVLSGAILNTKLVQAVGKKAGVDTRSESVNQRKTKSSIKENIINVITKTYMNKQKEKAFYSWGAGRFHLSFPNGNKISTIFADGSYSDEYDSKKNINFLLSETKESPTYNSDTCEIMFDCNDKLKRKILKKYNSGDDDPIGYLPFNKWLKIVNLLNK